MLVVLFLQIYEGFPLVSDDHQKSEFLSSWQEGVSLWIIEAHFSENRVQAMPDEDDV